MSHTAEPNNRCVMDAEPEAWLFEVRFEGRDEWSVYGVFRRKADADSLMRTAVMGLEGRLVPLYRPNTHSPTKSRLPRSEKPRRSIANGNAAGSALASPAE